MNRVSITLFSVEPRLIFLIWSRLVVSNGWPLPEKRPLVLVGQSLEMSRSSVTNGPLLPRKRVSASVSVEWEKETESTRECLVSEHVYYGADRRPITQLWRNEEREVDDTGGTWLTVMWSSALSTTNRTERCSQLDPAFLFRSFFLSVRSCLGRLSVVRLSITCRWSPNRSGYDRLWWPERIFFPSLSLSLSLSNPNRLVSRP